MPASREVFWNISYNFLMYPLMVVALVFFFYGFYRRIKYWKLGQQEEISGTVLARIKSLLVYAIGQGRILKEKYPGLIHVSIFIGFAFLFIGTVIVSFDYDIWHLLFGQSSFLIGDFYLIFSLSLSVFVVLA